MVEQLSLKQSFTGSIPVDNNAVLNFVLFFFAGVAQWSIAPDFQSGLREFESHHPYQYLTMRKTKVVPIYFVNAKGEKSKSPFLYQIQVQKFFLWLIPYWSNFRVVASLEEANTFLPEINLK